MKNEYFKILKRLLEGLDDNLQLRTARGYAASHPYQQGQPTRIYGKSDYDYEEEDEEIEVPDNFEKVKVSKAFFGDKDE